MRQKLHSSTLSCCLSPVCPIPMPFVDRALCCGSQGENCALLHRSRLSGRSCNRCSKYIHTPNPPPPPDADGRTLTQKYILTNNPPTGTRCRQLNTNSKKYIPTKPRPNTTYPQDCLTGCESLVNIFASTEYRKSLAYLETALFPIVSNQQSQQFLTFPVEICHHRINC